MEINVFVLYYLLRKPFFQRKYALRFFYYSPKFIAEKKLLLPQLR